MTIKQNLIPDMGGADGVEVIEVCVAVGDRVELEDSLVVLETDKASMEVPAEYAGTVVAVHVAEGNTVNEGALCIDIETEAAADITPEVEVQTAELPVESAVVAAPVEINTAEMPVVVPDLGGAEEVDVIEVCVAVGDTVTEGDSLLVLETDKASMEVPSPISGTVIRFEIIEGAKINEGQLVCVIASEQSAPLSASAPVDLAIASAAQTPTPVVSHQTVIDINMIIPDIGGAQDVDVIEVCVAVGDTVAEGDSLLVLETDKASMEVPAIEAGIIKSLAVSDGDKVNEGDVIGLLVVEGNEPVVDDIAIEPARPVEPRNVAHAEANVAPPAATEAGETHRDVHAGPAVRKLARELGVILERVTATGPRGRVLKDDLHSFVKSAMQAMNDKPVTPTSAVVGTGLPPRPTVDFSKFGEVETVALDKIAKLTAANMQRSWLNVPHVTQFDEADITDMEAFRKSLKGEAERRGVKVTPVAFLIKAVASALSQNPKFNSSLDATMEHRILKKYVNVGMAVDTPRGLVVPVIKDADKKGLWEIAADVIDLSIKARDGKLKPTEMQGACFTISSLGAMGGTGFTPIVNTPEVGILGVSKAQIKPIWNGSEFMPRNMLPLALSYDHCAINGGDAGKFMTTLVAELSDIRRLILI